jgi:hypothetical protein
MVPFTFFRDRANYQNLRGGLTDDCQWGVLARSASAKQPAGAKGDCVGVSVVMRGNEAKAAQYLF